LETSLDATNAMIKTEINQSFSEMLISDADFYPKEKAWLTVLQ